MAKLKINENRRAEEERKKEKAKTNFNQAENLQQKIDAIAEHLELKETDKEKKD